VSAWRERRRLAAEGSGQEAPAAAAPDTDQPVTMARVTGAELLRQMRDLVLNGAEDSHGFGVFAAFIVPTGDGGEMAWSAAAPRR
jgi:hypothetical protein